MRVVNRRVCPTIGPARLNAPSVKSSVVSGEARLLKVSWLYAYMGDSL